MNFSQKNSIFFFKPIYEQKTQNNKRKKEKEKQKKRKRKREFSFFHLHIIHTYIHTTHTHITHNTHIIYLIYTYTHTHTSHKQEIKKMAQQPQMLNWAPNQGDLVKVVTILRDVNNPHKTQELQQVNK